MAGQSDGGAPTGGAGGAASGRSGGAAPRAAETIPAPARISDSAASMGPWLGRPVVGTVIADTYRVQRTLGEGAMGIVVVAKDERLERDVAIKFIHPDYLASEGAHQRFIDEARTMARVRHENVVEIYSYGEHRASPYFVMEYVPGTTVEAWRRERGTLSIDEIIGVLEQACRGLTAIHRAGAVHRDLKPSNLLIGPAFRIAVADLGLAKLLGRPTGNDSDTVSGTPAYMCPELVLGTPLPSSMHERADVYSLGVLMFELMTGRLPFETDDAIEMMTHHVKDAPPVPSELRADIPSAFDGVFLRAMQKDPARRTPSADAFRRELLNARQSATATAPSLRFLVADDDEDFAALVRATLEWAFPGSSVECVHGGDEALRALDRRPAALAVIDLDMPGLNGIELTAALRGTASAEKMPILVVTASGGAPDWRLLSSLGADGFLVKPMDPMALVALARRTIESRSPEPR